MALASQSAVSNNYYGFIKSDTVKRLKRLNERISKSDSIFSMGDMVENEPSPSFDEEQFFSSN